MSTSSALRFCAALALLCGSVQASASAEPALEPIQIRVGEMVFDAVAAGPEDGELVLLLHGFPQTGHSYRHQLEALGEAGYRAVAPDQRGYSPGARPSEISDYAMSHLVGDVIGMALSLGHESFHLVGHDWGGAVAWVVATVQPQRVESLTALSTPHYLALARSYAQPESDQSRRSAYFRDFGAEGAETSFLADDMARLRSMLAGTGAPPEDLAVYLERLGSPAAMRGALNWYRALNASRAAGGSGAPPPTGGTRVPTLYLWGTEDPVFSGEAAQASGAFVDAPYTFHPIEGEGHWLPETAADTVTRLLLDHLATSGEATHAVSPERRFDPETRVFTSDGAPDFELPIPAGYQYLGRLEFPLKGIAWVDRHLFAQLDEDRIESLLVMQFEGFLDDQEGRYSFAPRSGEGSAGANYRFSPDWAHLGGHDYVHNTWAFDWPAGAAENPGAESDRTLRFLEGRGLAIDPGWIMSRYVRAVGEEGRDEIILFHLTPLAVTGHSLDDFPDGGPVSESYDALHRSVSEASRAIFAALSHGGD